MYSRVLEPQLLSALDVFPVVALLGPRQVGKTTLALQVSSTLDRETVYLDLERDSDRSKLDEAELYLQGHRGSLVLIDEIQRRAELFPLLRSLVDERRRAGDRGGHFLVLGSASRDLIAQSSESLAGRIAYFELAPFSVVELLENEENPEWNRIWMRGGFPDSYLAGDDTASWDWRTHFISTYLERDIPQLGIRLPSELTRRLWSMLAHGQGGQLNASRLAGSLGVSGNTVRKYLDVLTELYMVRQLKPWSGNIGKRLVKSPKVYVRDSGLLHRLAKITDLEMLLGHPLCGASWEGFVIEQLLSHLPDTWEATYYRTSAGTEIDLVLESPGGETWAIEIKRTLSPRIGRGFRLGCDDIGATRRFYVIPQGETYPLSADTLALPLDKLLEQLPDLSP